MLCKTSRIEGTSSGKGSIDCHVTVLEIVQVYTSVIIDQRKNLKHFEKGAFGSFVTSSKFCKWKSCLYSLASHQVIHTLFEFLSLVLHDAMPES